MKVSNIENRTKCRYQYKNYIVETCIEPSQLLILCFEGQGVLQGFCPNSPNV